MKQNVFTFSVIAIVILAVGFYTWSIVSKNSQLRDANNPAMQALAVGESEPGYTDMQGKPISLSESVGEILIVNSWASWSPDSAKELPQLAELAETYTESKVKIVAINRAEPAATAERFLNAIGVHDRVELILDLDDRYYKSIGGYSMPETIIYNKQGEIAFHGRGLVSMDILAEQIKLLLQPE